MRYPLDDSIYAVDNVWLGPPGKTTPWRARYVAYFLGAIVFVLVQVIERRMGIAIGFFPIAWGLLATVLITRGVLKLVNYDRPLFALFTAVGNEVSSPRRETRAVTTTLRPGLLPTLGDEEWSHKPARRQLFRGMLVNRRASQTAAQHEDSVPVPVTPAEPVEAASSTTIFDRPRLEGWPRSAPSSPLSLSKGSSPAPAPRTARRRLRLRPRRHSQAVSSPVTVDARSGLSELPHYGRDRARYVPDYRSAGSTAVASLTVTEPQTSSPDNASARETKETL